MVSRRFACLLLAASMTLSSIWIVSADQSHQIQDAAEAAASYSAAVQALEEAGLSQSAQANSNIAIDLGMLEQEETVDLSHAGTVKATDQEILDAAEQYLKDKGEPVPQQELIDYVCDMVSGAAGKERVRKLVVKRSLLKNSFSSKEGLPFGIRFLFGVGAKNKRLFELPPGPPVQQPIFGAGF